MKEQSLDVRTVVLASVGRHDGLIYIQRCYLWLDVEEYKEKNARDDSRTMKQELR